MFNSQSSSSSSSASSDAAYIDLASSSQSSSSSVNTSVSGTTNSSDSPANTSSSSSILSGEMNESTEALFYRINKQGGGDADMSESSEHHGQTVTSGKFQHMKNIINTPISSSTNNSSIDESTTSPYRSSSLSSTLTTEKSTYEFSSPRYFLSSVNKTLLWYQGSDGAFEFRKPLRPSRNLPNVTHQVETETPTVTVRNHIVVVDQAPFSVYKSVKSQESTEKTNSNLRVVNSNRNHPYNNSIRPSIITNQLASAVTMPNENQQSETTTDDGDIMTTNETFPVTQTAITRSSQASTSSLESKSTTRNSSSNAILAHLKSLGPNFKSIFVRPKNSKHIDSSLIMNKKSNVKDESNKSILNMLFSANGSKQTGIGSDGVSANSAIMKLLPNIEPKELKLNQSVDELLKKFATENDVLSRTIKRINEASSTRSMSPASTRSPSPVYFQSGSTMHHQRPDGTPTRSTTGHKSRISTSSMNKWTCMVCLSKHAFQIEICPVCGSCKSSMSPPQEISPNSSSSSSFHPNSTLNFSKHYNQHQTTASTSSSISSYLLNDLGFKHKLKEGISSESPAKNQQQSDTSSFTASSDSHNVGSSSRRDLKSSAFLSSNVANNPYLKKWTCLYCNYCNDSLKIVCLNCRQLKANQSLASTSKSTIRLLDETAAAAPKTSSGLSLNHDHADNEIRNGEATTPNKKSKDSETSQVCSSCKSPLHESTSLSKPLAEPVKTTPQPAQSLASLFATTSANKWTCSTCLVKNDDNKEVCVTCGTAKPQAKSASSTVSSITITSNQPSSDNSLGSIWATNSKDKWTCSTCLIKNENSKTACVSCMTPKPSTSESSTSQPTTSSIWSTASNKDKWTCPTCLIKNDEAKDTCVSCMTSKPNSKSAASTTQQSSASLFSQPSNSLSSLASGDKDKWTCSTCLVKNVDSASACVSCATPKPGGKPASSATSSLASQFGGSSSGGDKWTCSICLVKNDSIKAKCDACQSDKPGGSTTSKASLSSQPTLLFPATSSVSLPPANSSIKFGLSSNSVGANSFMSTSSTSDSASSNPIKFDSSVFSAKSSFSTSSSFTGANSTNSNTASGTPSFNSLFGSNKTTTSTSGAEFKAPFTFGSTTPADKVESNSNVKSDTVTTTTATTAPAISFGSQAKLDFTKPPASEPPKDFFSTLSSNTGSTAGGSLFKLPTTLTTIGSTAPAAAAAAETSSSQAASTTPSTMSFSATPFKLDSSTPLSLSTSNQVKPFTFFGPSAGQTATITTTEKPMTPFASFATPKETTPLTSPQAAASSTSTTTPGSLFGANSGTTSASTTQQPSSTSTLFSFGSSSTGSAPSLFGSNKPTAQPTGTTTSLFGNPATTALSNTPQTATNQPFGNQFSLFGASNPSTTSITTAPATNTTTSGFQFSFNKPSNGTGDGTGGLFGSAPPNQTIQAPTTTPSSLFSNTGTNSSNQFGLMFGASPATSVAAPLSTATPAAQPASFAFNLTPNMNFNFGATAAPPGLNQNGIIQFSGSTETSTTTEGRKIRRAKRTFR